jgi:hypothetical protein
MPETPSGPTAAAEKPNVPKASSLSQTEKSAVALGPEGVRGTIASPQGPLPIGAVARDEEHAEELLQEQEERVEKEKRRSALDVKLTREEMEGMSAGDLRAVAATRGYEKYPLAGKRTLVDFLDKQQAGDERFLRGKK